MDTTIRNIDEDAYRRLKAKAAMEGIPVGKALSLAISSWLKADAGDKRKRSLLEINPEPLGAQNARLSEEIDEILYSGS